MAEWGTIQVQVPEFIQDLAEIIDSFAQALLAVLNIALAILQVVKAFLIGFLDPLAAIVNAIINEIQAFLDDLRQVGLYVAGDFKLGDYPFESVLGGFTGYERRMIGRLVDRTDPTRPDFSSRSLVVAVFLYVNVDVTAIYTLVEFISKVLAFFGQRKDIKQFTVPVNLEVSYGVEGAALSTFGSLFTSLKNSNETPDVANLRWRMSPPPGQQPISWPLPKPAGFLIEVSTIQEGLLLAWDSPAKNAQLDDNSNQSRINGVIKDPLGRPLRLYGGYDQIDENGRNLATDALNFQGDPKPGAARVFAFRDSNDNVPIPLSQLKDGDDYILQRTFFVSTNSAANPLLTGPGQGFAFQLKAEDMPYNASFTLNNNGTVNVEKETERATTVYVRVAPVSAAVTGVDSFQWSLSEQLVTSKGQSGQEVVVDVSASTGLSPQDRGEPSAPLTVTFPGATTLEYIDTLTVALMVLVLSRADLNPVDDATLAEVETQEEAVLSAQVDVISAQVEVDAAAEQVSQENTAANQAVLEAAQASLEAAQAAFAEAQADLSKLMPFAQDVGRQATGLEDVGRYLVPQILGRNPAKYFKKARVSPSDFRSDLLRRCRAVANRLYRNGGTLGTNLESIVVDRGEILRTFTWSDLNDAYPNLTILESMDPNSFSACVDDSGTALNPLATGVPERDAQIPNLFRTPGFRASPEFDTSATQFQMGAGSADMSPVIFSRTGPLIDNMQYIRNAFFANADIYSAAAEVLAISAAPSTLVRAPGEGGWIAYRLLPQGIPAIEQFLDDVLKWLRTIQAGLDSIIEVIKAYINLIEARILELQALINRINNLIQSLAALQVPSASGLVVVTNGTDGVIGELVTATNKPSDSATSYGGGVVILSGGLNSSVASLLQAFFSAG